MEGLNIQIRLKKLRLTQRWLVEQLHRRGYKKVSETMLSNILTGYYAGPVSEGVLKTADEILKKQES